MSKTVIQKFNNLYSDFKGKLDSGDTKDLSLSDMFAISELAKELIKHKAVKTFIASVAHYFSLFGFLVTMDFDGVNYVIVA